MPELMQNFNDKRWVELVESFRERIEEDKIHFKCWSTYVKLPEICPQPKYCLIGMEPGPGKNHNEPEYKNFIASKEDFIIHYCAYYYLGEEGFNYQMTDMAKGGIEIDDAYKTREERYRIWLPLLRNELDLLGNPEIIFIGKGTYAQNTEWRLNLSVPKDNYILQHGGNARGHIKNYYNSIKDKEKYDPPKDVMVKIKELADILMKKNNYSSHLKDSIFKEELNKDLTDADKKLLAVYRYDFERISKKIKRNARS